MGSKRRTHFALASIAAGFGHVASAHVTLEQSEAVAGSYHKAVLQVGHGCNGSPTTAVTLQVPEGVASAKPQPKPGWTLTIKRSTLAKPIDAGHGRVVSEVVSEVTWSGGPLPDEQFEEFRVVMKLPSRPGATLYVPVVQQCQQGSSRWVDLPATNKSGAAPRMPAPVLRLRSRR